MADATRQSDALPSISFIDLEKIKRENYYQSRIPSSAANSMPAPPLVSPSSMYSGPPPPYSYPSSTTSSVVGGHTNAYISPPTELRKSIDEDKDQQQSARQSLPSIHALTRDQPLSISSLLTNPGVPQPPANHLQNNANHSPTSPVDRMYREIPSTRPPLTPSQTHSSPTYSQGLPRQHHSPRPTLDATNNRQPSSVTREAHYPPMLPPRIIPSPAGANRTTLSSTTLHRSSPPYDAAPRPIPVTNQPQIYASYPAPYSYAPPMPPAVSTYQPPSPSNTSRWRCPEGENERVEEYRRNPMKEALVKPSYGEAVKRHLDNFDLETSLNEIAEGSGRALDFCKHYGSRAHQTQRSGPVPGSMPTLAECDELMDKQRRVLESMQRIKEVVVAQQHALAEQRNYENSYKPSAEPDDDGANFHDKSEGGGGFAGAEAKKRRGRAAPPGRCHSCNRAETPEWRRGPDGARTLCNACGLHYAKLTRKMGSKSSNGGSNLRPKEMSQGSP
ncbi:MAG: hypothetical protein LQ348_000143 [Seirophora lacunosa]|nr:MAG: hypothetical protein LQ348_000143 [Seirophora lacunosa]